MFLCALMFHFAFRTLSVEVPGIILQVEFSCICIIMQVDVPGIISSYYIDGRQELYCWCLALLGDAFLDSVRRDNPFHLRTWCPSRVRGAHSVNPLEPLISRLSF